MHRIILDTDLAMGAPGSVVTGDGIARGVMVTDLLHAADPPSPNCRIATAVDAGRLTEVFLAALASL